VKRRFAIAPRGFNRELYLYNYITKSCENERNLESIHFGATAVHNVANQTATRKETWYSFSFFFHTRGMARGPRPFPAKRVLAHAKSVTVIF